MTSKDTTVAAATAAAQPDSAAIDNAFNTLKTYDWGADREALKPIDQAIIATQGDAMARKAMERRLVDALAGGLARSAQDYVCRRLRVVGTAQSVETWRLFCRMRRPRILHVTPWNAFRTRRRLRRCATRCRRSAASSSGHYRLAGQASRRQEHQSHFEAFGRLRHPCGPSRGPIPEPDRHIGCSQGTEPVCEESARQYEDPGSRRLPHLCRAVAGRWQEVRGSSLV